MTIDEENSSSGLRSGASAPSSPSGTGKRRTGPSPAISWLFRSIAVPERCSASSPPGGRSTPVPSWSRLWQTARCCASLCVWRMASWSCGPSATWRSSGASGRQPCPLPGPDRSGGDPLCHLQPGGPSAGAGRRLLRPLPGPLPGRGGSAVPGAAAAPGDPLRRPRLSHPLGADRSRTF